MKRARELSLPRGDDYVTVAFLDVRNVYPGYHELLVWRINIVFGF